MPKNEVAERNNYQLIFGHEETRQRLAKALPSNINIDKFEKTVYLAVRKNPAILECTKDSMFLAFVEAATMGLDPSVSNSCFFIPRSNKGVKELSMQVGYRTIINWVMNSGLIADINVEVVYEGEEFEIIAGTSPAIIHKPNPDIEKNWENIRYVYGIANTVNGGKIWRYLDKKEIEKRRSKAKTEYIWKEWPVEMTKKTGLIYLSKYLPMNTELAGRLDKQEAKTTGADYEGAGDVNVPKTNIKTAEQKADEAMGPK